MENNTFFFLVESGEDRVKITEDLLFSFLKKESTRMVGTGAAIYTDQVWPLTEQRYNAFPSLSRMIHRGGADWGTSVIQEGRGGSSASESHAI